MQNCFSLWPKLQEVRHYTGCLLKLLNFMEWSLQPRPHLSRPHKFNVLLHFVIKLFFKEQNENLCTRSVGSGNDRIPVKTTFAFGMHYIRRKQASNGTLDP